MGNIPLGIRSDSIYVCLSLELGTLFEYASCGRSSMIVLMCMLG